MDIAAHLRSGMAVRRLTVAAVADMLGRTSLTVTRYRTGESPIPLEAAQILFREGIIPADAVLYAQPQDGAA